MKLTGSYSAGLIATSSGFLVAASPALAADVNGPDFGAAFGDAPTVGHPLSGYLEVYGGLGSFDYLQDDGGRDSDDFHRLGGAGRLNYWFNDRFAAQFDIHASDYRFDEGSGGQNLGGTVHLAHRDPDGYAFGALASYARTDRYFWHTADDANWANVAGQAQIYLGDDTLYFQTGYFTNLGSTADEYPSSGVYGALQGRHFINPNLALIGDVTVANASVKNGELSHSTIRWGVGLEAKLPDHPLSGYVRYQGHHTQGDYNGNDFEFDEHTVFFGLKLFAHQDSLLSNDRTGATFLDLNPQFGQFNTKFMQ